MACLCNRGLTPLAWWLSLLRAWGQQALLLDLQPCACPCYCPKPERHSDALCSFLTAGLPVQALTTSQAHLPQVLFALSVLLHVFLPQNTFLQQPSIACLTDAWDSVPLLSLLLFKWYLYLTVCCWHKVYSDHETALFRSLSWLGFPWHVIHPFLGLCYKTAPLSAWTSLCVILVSFWLWC